MNNFSSKLLETAVNELAKLPGIGRKTSVRLALHLLRQNNSEVEALGNALIKMRNEISFCKICFNVSDSEICDICNDKGRDAGLVCVVEDVRDVMAIENTSQFKGTISCPGRCYISYGWHRTGRSEYRAPHKPYTTRERQGGHHGSISNNGRGYYKFLYL